MRSIVLWWDPCGVPDVGEAATLVVFEGDGPRELECPPPRRLPLLWRFISGYPLVTLVCWALIRMEISY